MKEIWDAFKYWLIGKFDEKYNPLVEEVNFLRLSLERERIENKRLTDIIVSISNPKPNLDKDNNEEVEPITNRRYIPWNVKRRELELKDREKALAVKREVEQALDKNKSIEQLEKEILGED